MPIDKVVYIISINYSGSTILSLWLQTLANTYFVGEPSLIFRKKGRAYKHQKFCTPCKLIGQEQNCPVWGRAKIEYLRQNQQEYLSFLKKNLPATAKVVIDSSKSLSWIDANLNESAESYILHISKPAHAYIASLKKKDRIKYGNTFHAIGWAEANARIMAYAKSQDISYKFIAYDSFTKYPETILAELAAWLDIPYRKKKQFVGQDHYVKGNPGVSQMLKTISQGGLKIKADDSWKEWLSESELDRIYTSARVRNISTELGLAMPIDDSKIPPWWRRWIGSTYEALYRFR